MADFTAISTTKNSDLAMCDKFEAFVSIAGTTSTYETVGVVSNDQTWNYEPEFVEYKDGFADWAICKTSQMTTFEFMFMQPGVPKLVAIALGLSETDTSDTSYEAVNITSTRKNPPKLRWKFVGETLEGKAVELEFLKAQVKSSMAMTIGNDISGVPITVQAVVDETSTENFDVARFRVEV